MISNNSFALVKHPLACGNKYHMECTERPSVNSESVK